MNQRDANNERQEWGRGIHCRVPILLEVDTYNPRRCEDHETEEGGALVDLELVLLTMELNVGQFVDKVIRQEIPCLS